MRLGEALAQIGVPLATRGDICLVRPNGGRFAHFRLPEIADDDIDADEIYIASGLFAPGAITRWEGRNERALQQILWLPFDFDLADWLQLDRETIYRLPAQAIAPLLEGQRRDVEAVFAHLGLPIHWLIATGHGLCAGVRLPAHEPRAIPEIRRLHKAIVQRINRLAGYQLADPQVSDAGTRITRVPGSVNRKGSEPKPVTLLAVRDGVVTEEQLRSAASAPAVIAQAIPAQGDGLDTETEEALIEAVRPSWQQGQRHLIALGLAGMLAKVGVPESQARRIIERLASDDPEVRDRIRAVETSYSRARTGLSVEGFTVLRDYLPMPVLEWVDARLQEAAERSRPRVALDYRETVPAADAANEDYAPLPEECLRGWIGDYVALMEPTTEAPAGYHYGVGMTLAGATIGRRVGVLYGSDPLFANLYTLLIGPSGRSRKDTAIKRATRLLTEPVQLGPERFVDTGVRVSTDVGSAEGLIRILQEQPNTLLYLTEFSRLIQQARRKGTQTILPILIEAFDTPPVLENLNKANPIEARYPYLSVLSATQPEILAGLMASDDLHSGFANRWLYVLGTGNEPLPYPPALDRQAAARLYWALWEQIRSYGEGTLLRLNEPAAARWEAWYRADYAQRSRSPEEDAMRVRHAVLIQKLALIYAVSEGARAIDAAHLEPAIAAVQWMWAHVQRLIPTWGATVDGQIEERICEVLRKRGPLPRRVLQQQCRNPRRWGTVEFNRVLTALRENGVIEIDPAGIVMLAIDPSS